MLLGTLYSPLDLEISFHVDSGYPLYRIVTLLPEPLTVVLAVYCESESSGAVLIGAELQNSVLSVERSLKLGRSQFARKFVWAQSKQGFRPFLIQPDRTAIALPPHQSTDLREQLINAV